ncbi:F-box protein At2g26160-like [Macadamia integrifolia]|uniref:F-box protein At2g26160-like n=1 Tax=Macadamia integrifolia TaxID=60698 RepID=UPI001C4FB7E7|nr:F-box protein At2g26160-like [Macadamia integrifolia]
MADWSGLPELLLESIARRLSIADLIRFSCVCTSWRSITLFLKGKLLPWLIIPCVTSNNPRKKRIGSVCDKNLGIISLSDPTRRVYELDLPEAADRRICGSSAGWLVTVHANSEIRLLQPFTRAQIQLPPLTAFPSHLPVPLQQGERFKAFLRDEYIHKAIVGFCSSESEAMVMAIRREDDQLAFCRPGKDLRWSIFEHRHHGRSHDVIFYKEQFYTVKESGRIFKVSGLEDASPHMTLVTGRPMMNPSSPNKPYLVDSLGELLIVYPNRLYLVESSGELLIIYRFLDSGFPVGEDDEDDDEDAVVDSDDNWREPARLPYRTINFEVFKLDFAGGKWVEVENLGDRAVFVGYNDSFSVSASEFPGCKGNCIYFTDDYFEGYYRQKHGACDMGIFDLGDRTVEPLVCGNETQSFMPPSVWFSMNPWWRGGLDVLTL